MPTFSVPITNNEIRLAVNVAKDPAERDEGFSWTALLDTGATCTFVTSRVVERLALLSISVGSFIPANGEAVETDVFRVAVGVPIALGNEPTDPTFSTGKIVEVMLLPFLPEGWDVLFGMDLISSYHITLHGGLFVCSN